MSKRRLVIAAVLAGQSQSEVARTYGVSQGWISRLMTRHRAEGRLRDLTIDPRRDYQPTGRPPGPPKKT
jgi:transposase